MDSSKYAVETAESGPTKTGNFLNMYFSGIISCHSLADFSA